jgi:hypothetical protein
MIMVRESAERESRLGTSLLKPESELECGGFTSRCDAFQFKDLVAQNKIERRYENRYCLKHKCLVFLVYALLEERRYRRQEYQAREKSHWS